MGNAAFMYLSVSFIQMIKVRVWICLGGEGNRREAGEQLDDWIACVCVRVCVQVSVCGRGVSAGGRGGKREGERVGDWQAMPRPWHPLSLCSFPASLPAHTSARIASAFPHPHVPLLPVLLQAMMPLCVFTVGCLLGTEKYQHAYLANMALVTVGVAVASYGELHFHVLGVLLQTSSLITE